MNTYAGLTLAQLAEIAPTDAAGVASELQARIARNGKSAKRAQEALARLEAGASVAIPAKPAKDPATPAAPKAPKAAPKGNPNHAQVRTNALGRPVVSPEQAFKLVMDLGRSSGHSIPRWISAGAKGRMPAAKA